MRNYSFIEFTGYDDIERNSECSSAMKEYNARIYIYVHYTNGRPQRNLKGPRKKKTVRLYTSILSY